MNEPSPDNEFQSAHAALLMASFEAATGRALLPGEDARQLYHAPFPVLSHDTAADPVLTYGNLAAQALWEMDWAQLTSMPSRLTAEPGHRGQRDAMFAQMREKGCIENYAGVRISATGKRFEIREAVIWRLVDADGVLRGEAATFRDYLPL
ncbi:MEKHLA domain-containing protein [Phaeobacter italicus]|jgi:hypothetical protein|uniref:MEKHLA domain-containing protein n=1 Tax=Phaeobacter italicus TaxID=481446 RepID=UPI001CD6D1CB|nr:MEKHLA domain-containing protein [Phaeobacter italicus]MCA0856616.1 MEKHLA domain-containing protein [Phaeobacter italicus]